MRCKWQTPTPYPGTHDGTHAYWLRIHPKSASPGQGNTSGGGTAAPRDRMTPHECVPYSTHHTAPATLKTAHPYFICSSQIHGVTNPCTGPVLELGTRAQYRNSSISRPEHTQSMRCKWQTPTPCHGAHNGVHAYWLRIHPKSASPENGFP